MRVFLPRLTGGRLNREYARQCAGVGADLPALSCFQTGNHAYGCLPVFLRMQQLQNVAATEAWGLLRFLLLRFGEVPACSGEPLMLPLKRQCGMAN